ncbi:hypothetical protein K435DRAFT_965654 [Dendrothele bispora CBS 962.96]|uniref:Uncharacterized protein n=1 Tax=Dendrothele bispora (strain CBS 962.96) TaxID=1314807 RepID=A0A4S8M4L0_DENBC|nr:hypothetical protein K435DRAFT_965654 [Dendrothele bispora CBS 962.96]
MLYGYEITDDLLKHYEPFKHVKEEAAASDDPPFPRRDRSRAFFMAAGSVGFYPSTMRGSLGFGNRVKSSHPEASGEDIYYIASWISGEGTQRLCVAEERLRELEAALKTDIKAKWIVL